MALTQIKTTAIADNAVTDAKVADNITASNYLPLAGGTLTGDLTIPQKIVHSGDTDTYLSFGTDSLSLYTGGTNVVSFEYGNAYIKQNNKALTGYTTGGGAKELIKIDGSDVVQIGEGLNTTFAGAVQVNDNNITAKMTTAGAGIRSIVDRVDASDYAGFEVRTGGNQRWFIGAREDSTDNLQFFNGNSSGTVQNVLTLNHSDSSATFAGWVRATGVFYANDNGASNPGFRFYNAASGMYHAGSDNIGFAVSGNNVATLTASSATFAGTIYSQMSSTSDYGNEAFRTKDGNNYEGVRIQHGGGNGKILLYSSNSHRGTITANQFTSHTNGQTLGSTANESCVIMTNNTTRVTIANDGNTTFTGQITVGSDVINNGNIYSNGTSGSHYLGLSNKRWHTVYGVNSNFSSDQTLKKNIKTSDLGIDFINSLNPVKFNWKKSFQDDSKNHYGFLAQEIAKTALADSVNGDEGEMGMNYSELIAPIVKAVQELSAKVTALEGN